LSLGNQVAFDHLVVRMRPYFIAKQKTTGPPSFGRLIDVVFKMMTLDIVLEEHFQSPFVGSSTYATLVRLSINALVS
jgi:hypothetical protein